MKLFFLLPLSLLAVGCTTPVAVSQQNKHEYLSAVQELRYEIADVKHALGHAQVEIQLLDEQLKSQEKQGKVIKPQADLEKRICQIEASQKKLGEELKLLSSHAGQTTQCFTDYSNKISSLEKSLSDQHLVLSQIAEIKSSLLTLGEEEKNRTYMVKPGDSLEKIAKLHKVTVKNLKESNRLSQDKIRVGQELKIPD